VITLITASLDEDGLGLLRKHGEVRYQPMAETRQMLGGSRLVRALDGVDVFITEADNLKAREIGMLTTLQIICSCRGNPVNIDVAAATERGIPVIHAPGRNADSVADLALALMLMLARNILPAADTLRNRQPGTDMTALAKVYFELRGHELWSKTVGIVGLGAIGKKVAQRLQPFGARVLAFDPYVPDEIMSQHGAHKVDLDTLLRESDFVTLHVSVNESTKGLIGEREIGLMKPTAYFINTARAAITVEAALIKALQEKRIAGAGLDVYEKEPLPVDHPLMLLDRVVLLPHIGGATHEVTVHQTQIIVPDIERLIRGERPLHIMNPQVLERFRFQTERPS
jgi:autoinducer 2 (AI-2) kinase